MNAAQRKFIIEKVQKNVADTITELSESKLKYPSASNYIFKAVLNDSLQLQPPEKIIAALKAKALKAKEGQNWLSGKTMGWDRERVIEMDIEQLIVIPDDYRQELDRVQQHNKEIDNRISVLQAQSNGIEMRVQLASDKTLQRLINEVDDMGDLSLVDTKLKLLS